VSSLPSLLSKCARKNSANTFLLIPVAPPTMNKLPLPLVPLPLSLLLLLLSFGVSLLLLL
jgi:hypothetical protein